MAQYSFRLPNADYLGFPATTEAIVKTACKAEELGFDALFVNDHVIVDDSPRKRTMAQRLRPADGALIRGGQDFPDNAGNVGADNALPQPNSDRQNGRHP